jgi:hypothetical protein
MQPVSGPGPLLSQIIRTVRQQPQTHAMTLGVYQAQPRVVHRHCGHRGRIQRIGLASMTAVEQPSPRSQLSRHIHHLLTRTRQPLSHTPTQALRALYRPATLRPPGRPLLQLAHRGRGDRDPSRGHWFPSGLDRHRGQRALVRVNPDCDHAQPSVDSMVIPRRAP